MVEVSPLLGYLDQGGLAGSRPESVSSKILMGSGKNSEADLAQQRTMFGRTPWLASSKRRDEDMIDHILHPERSGR